MVAHRTALALPLAALAALLPASAPARPPAPAVPGPPPAVYWPSSACANCHPSTAEQHGASHHEGSARNPLFQAQYFQELLPRASEDPALLSEARGCTACHAPVVFASQGAHLTAPVPAEANPSGVTCDLCHTISGIEGPAPGNGNFVSRPSDVKLGPFPGETGWHRTYAELQTRSELCATCHQAVNRHGVVVKGTYSEWKRSPAAGRGVQCQDCHMTSDGFQVEGRSRFERGKAASASNLDPPARARLFSHRFPGAHSRSQVQGAVGVSFRDVPARARPGEPFSFSVVVDNHRAGHRTPTGSADLRLLWLEVTARSGARSWPIPMPFKAIGDYGVAGAGDDDAAQLGGDVPAGARTYRAVFFDARGRQTLSSYDARRVVWDNRLEAGERRVERFRGSVPGAAGGALRLEARLVYLSHPTALARRLGVPAAQPVEVATAAAELTLSPEEPPPAVLRGGPDR